MHTFGNFKASIVLERMLRAEDKKAFARVATILASYFKKLNDVGSMNEFKSRAYFSLLHYKNSTGRVTASKSKYLNPLVKEYVCNIMHAAYSEFFKMYVEAKYDNPDEIWINSFGKTRKYRRVK